MKEYKNMSKHNDCENFEFFDVAKGYCVNKNGLVPFDGEACECFRQKAKCKNCSHFSRADEQGIGRCDGLEDRDYWALGERVALNCEGDARA